jgi:hypothetical protein
LTTKTRGPRERPATGAISRMKLNLRLPVERRVACVRNADQERRISVGRRIHDRLRGDVRASAWPVLDDKGLAKKGRTARNAEPVDPAIRKTHFRQRIAAIRTAAMSALGPPGRMWWPISLQNVGEVGDRTVATEKTKVPLLV